MAEATTRKTPARKTPQDRKPAQADVDAARQTRFEDIDGHELVKPFSKVRGSDQWRLIAQLRSTGLLNEDEETPKGAERKIDLDGLDAEALADFTEWFAARFAVDEEKFWEKFSGQGAMQSIIEICFAYVGELGKGVSSEDS